MYGTLNGLAAVRETAYVLVETIVGPAGFVSRVGFIGPLGLCPRLSAVCPRLARAAGLFGPLGAVGVAVNTVSTIGNLLVAGAGGSASDGSRSSRERGA